MGPANFYRKNCFSASCSPNPSCIPNLKLLSLTVAEINSLLWISTVIEIRACLPVGGATSSACRRQWLLGLQACARSLVFYYFDGWDIRRCYVRLSVRHCPNSKIESQKKFKFGTRTPRAKCNLSCFFWDHEVKGQESRSPSLAQHRHEMHRNVYTVCHQSANVVTMLSVGSNIIMTASTIKSQRWRSLEALWGLVALTFVRW